MKLLSLNCNSCGAPLEVPDKANYITCQFCESRLQVHQTATTAYTEVLEELGRKTDKIADEVAILKLQNQLNQTDMDWDRKKQTFMIKGKDGHLSVPTKVGSFFLGIFGTGFGLMMMVVASGSGQPAFMLFGVVALLFAIGGAMQMYSKAESFEKAQKSYRRKRLDLVSRMHD